MTTTPSFYKTTKLTMILTTLGITVGMGAVAIFGIQPAAPNESRGNALAHPSSLNAVANGCGEIFQFQNLDDPEYVKLPAEVIIPSYGEISAETETLTPEQITYYPPEILETENGLPFSYQALMGSLYYDDVTILWYIKTADASALQSIQKTVDDSEGTIIALPWLFETSLPFDRNIAFTKWGYTQSCEFWEPTVLTEFQTFVQEHGITKLDDTESITFKKTE